MAVRYFTGNETWIYGPKCCWVNEGAETVVRGTFYRGLFMIVVYSVVVDRFYSLATKEITDGMK